MQERTGAAVAAAPAPTPAAQMVQKSESGKYEETRIQIRLPDGSQMVQKFKAKEPLSAVRVGNSIHLGHFSGPFWAHFWGHFFTLLN